MGQAQAPTSNACLVYYPPDGVAYLVTRPPEIVIDSSLVKYSGLDSMAVLHGYMSTIDKEKVTEYTEKIGSALGDLNTVPNGVGLGALVISMILQAILGSRGQPSTADMLRRVFAEEKASEIRDLMDEYMKRLRINLGSPHLQLEDTKRIEALLSTQVTRLKNSMLTDGQMSPRGLKHWVNGAAFHAQMLTHQARLEGGDGNRASGAVEVYQRDLNHLQNNYRTYVSDFTHDVWTKDQNLGNLKCNMELPGPIRYFSDLKRNIPALVRQRHSFSIG